jgi:hypothetical protein
LIGELRNQKTLVLGLHVSFMDTDMTKGYEMKKIDPRQVAEAGLTGIGANREGYWPTISPGKLSEA